MEFDFIGWMEGNYGKEIIIGLLILALIVKAIAHHF